MGLWISLLLSFVPFNTFPRDVLSCQSEEHRTRLQQQLLPGQPTTPSVFARVEDEACAVALLGDGAGACVAHTKQIPASFTVVRTTSQLVRATSA